MPARRDFGSVRQLPSKRWQATWKIGPDRFKAERTFPTKTDAKNYLSEVENQLAKGTYIAPNQKISRTVEFVGEQWLVSNPNKTEASCARDRSILTQHVNPSMGKRNITTVGRHDIEKMVKDWSTRTVTDDEGNEISQPVSPETVRRQYTCMASMFNYAVMNGWIPGSPCVKIPLPAKKPVERYLPTPKDIQRLAEAIGEDQAASVYVGAEIGIRWNEIFALQVGDVKGDTLTISRGITRTSSGGSAVSHESVKAQTRTVRLSGELAQVLKEHIARLDNRKPGAWLFPDSDGGLIRYNNWRNRVWLPALKTAGLDKAKPALGIHDLRRLAATRMFADGTDLRTIMHRLGQKTATLAAEVYARADEDADKAQADRMGEFIFSS